MLMIVLPMICFFFLAFGAVVFVVCGLVSPLRRFALSAALWCAAWGPCACASLLLAGLALIVEGFAPQGMKTIQLRAISAQIAGWTYFWAAVAATAMAATVLAWVHQALVRRFTFALFRIYVTLVSAGVGTVWGLTVWFCFGLHGMGLVAGVLFSVLEMALAVSAFGYCGFKFAHLLRGGAPERFAWATREEFEGTS